MFEQDPLIHFELSRMCWILLNLSVCLIAIRTQTAIFIYTVLYRIFCFSHIAENLSKRLSQAQKSFGILEWVQNTQSGRKMSTAIKFNIALRIVEFYSISLVFFSISQAVWVWPALYVCWARLDWTNFTAMEFHLKKWPWSWFSRAEFRTVFGCFAANN